jgi:transposase-like protein
MKFNSLKDAVKAAAALRVTAKGRRTYPVLFKKALIEALNEKIFKIAEIQESCGIRNGNIYLWMSQYKDGLYSMEGAYTVSKKSKEVNADILDKLGQELNELTEKIELIKRARELGLNING